MLYDFFKYIFYIFLKNFFLLIGYNSLIALLLQSAHLSGRKNNKKFRLKVL